MSRFGFTLDVLTDGSEQTGHGTLFLSVWKKPKQQTNTHSTASWFTNETIDVSLPKARYAISGLGDALARLCADQRLKLAPLRAVFFPNNQECADGLSAALLALHTAGASSLHLVSPETENMEEMTEIILGRGRSIHLPTCQIPQSTELSQWWKVYEDEFLLVHASSQGGDATFLYSLRWNQEKYVTIVLPPPQCDQPLQFYRQLQSGALPLLHDEVRISMDYVVILNPKMVPKDASIKELMQQNGTEFLLTLPKQTIDPGLFIRAQKVASYFHTDLPASFPVGYTNSSSIREHDHQLADDGYPCHVLESCTSVVLDEHSYSVLDRKRVFQDRPWSSDEWACSMELLRKFVSPSQTTNQDENEIDLDELNESEEEEECDMSQTEPVSGTSRRSKPHLVVLGTGCASPSAVRGASGYALLQPPSKPGETSEILLIEAGEGVCTMLCRSQVLDWETRITGIWISHAHLDHYGGLPNVVRRMHSCRAAEAETAASESKKRKRPEIIINVPWIMAPPKVLRFLDLSLHCRHGKHCTTGEQWFLPRVHQDPTQPPGPWTHFQSIPVDHNCCPAYGLLLGWKKSDQQQEQQQWLCFSGDTRPSRRLIDAIHRFRRNPQEFLLLVHEATFEDNEQEQAMKKKHSTVSEALQVARDVAAHRVLLTHFSQRYVALKADSSSSSSNVFANHNLGGISVALAVDGLWISLE